MATGRKSCNHNTILHLRLTIPAQLSSPCKYNFNNQLTYRDDMLYNNVDVMHVLEWEKT